MKRNQQANTSWPGCLASAFLLCAIIGRSYAQTPDGFNPGADNEVYAIAQQRDAKILLGGYFLNLGGQPCSYFGRLTTNGLLDASFNPGPDYGVYAVAMQDDGKILIAGEFDTWTGQPREGIARLNTDGSLDTAFNPGVSGSAFCLAVQTDGKILVGGHFTALAGQALNNIGRLNPDGTLDALFNPGATKSSYTSVDCLAIQTDGKIVVGGSFTTLGGQSRTNLGRLNPDGNLDGGFNPGAGDYYSEVASVAVQGDGKILVGGGFTTLAGQAVTNLARLNVTGALDTAFNPGVPGGVVSLALQADGKILLGGPFTNLCGALRTYIGRINSNGTLDPGFNPPASGGSYPYPNPGPYVNSLALQADGNLLVGGHFTVLAGQTRTNIGRLINMDPAPQSLVFDGATVTWLRGGTSPEVWRVRIDVSTNGLDWISPGPAARIPGGWQVGGLALPTNATVRVRGFATGGYCNASTWFVENVVGPPAIVSGPDSRTNNAGTLAAFNVQAAGSGALSYRWLKNGSSLTDGGNVSGSQTPSLTISNVLGADAADYSVIVDRMALR